MEPLAAKIRPQRLEEFVGQEHLVGAGKPLRVAMQHKHLLSFIVWGPPGVGKTTLARLYAKAVGALYHELSAVNAGKDDIRKIIDKRDSITGTFYATVLFIDEIHRFNKVQQDFLLPFVESGALILIGATTENPSFEIIPALLSRCQVFVLKELTPEDMSKIIERTGITVPDAEREWLIQYANGDARQIISLLENTAKFYTEVTIKHLEDTAQNLYIRYDKKAEEHYNTISAFIKSMRASDADAALYYLARMVKGGEDPLFIARRMVIFASEDIGLADPQGLTVANNVFRAVEIIGYPECAINLAHGVSYLALASKSRDSYEAYGAAVGDVKKTGNLPIPLAIRNAPTQLMKDLEYGKGYQMYSKESYLPESLKGKKYLKYSRSES